MPTQDDIAKTFKNHYEYYCRIGGETCQQQLEGERALKLQYAGRTLFELLQNAFDRADRHVLVAIIDQGEGDQYLVVGNDGQPVNVDPTFDYDSPPDVDIPGQRSDFHALCSIHTSNKAPDESIGNKGVGFRSVFSVASWVQVWSRVAESESWWGLELHRELTRTRWRQRLEEDPRARQGHRILLGDEKIWLSDDRPRPSFYFPLPLWSDDPPINLPDNLSQLVTFIIVPLNHQAYDTVEQGFKELREAHFHFVGLRPPKRAVKVYLMEGHHTEVRSCWFDATSRSEQVSLLAWWPPREGWNSDKLTKLADMAKKAEHAVSRPGLAVAWPVVNVMETGSTKLYCYLPTLITSPFSVDVHADFQLGLDRTNLKTSGNEPIGQYNRALLEAAAELHLIVVLRHLGYETDAIRTWTPRWKWIQDPESCEIAGSFIAEREDLWRSLNPNGHRSHPLVEHLEGLLFGTSARWNDAQQYEKWAQLAKRFFDRVKELKLSTFDAFWLATAAWLDHCGYNRHTKTWRNCAIAVCEALRQVEARVVPLIELAEYDEATPVTQWEPLPERREERESTERAQRRLFLRRSVDGEAAVLHLPEAVRRRGRAITAYCFPSGVDDPEMRPTGAVPLDRWALLQELRQLPNDLDRWIPRPLADDSETAEREQRVILRFAAELFTARFGRQKPPQEHRDHYGPGWRAHKKDSPYTEDELRAGRAIATLFLPTVTGRWEPARQLWRDQVDPEWLKTLQEQVTGLELDAFLNFLGVSPQQRLLLVEGGKEGLVPPQAVPPELVDAGSGTIPPLAIPLDVDQASSRPLVDILREAWPWLSSLVKAEREGKLNADLWVHLKGQAWYPVDESRGAIPPFGLTTRLEVIPPEAIVLQPETPDRRLNVLWRVRSTSQDAEMLKVLGAIPNLSDEVLQQDNAHPARRLITQLTELDLRRISDYPSVRQGLIELFQILLEAIARAGSLNDQPIPLLAYMASESERPLTERSLTWIQAGEPGWIASDNHQRELLRRFFPHLPLVTATIGRNMIQRLEWMAQRAITVKEEPKPEPLPHGIPSLADTVRASIEPLLPGLLALAAVSRLIPQGIDDQKGAERWRHTRFVHVAKAWVEVSAHGAGLATEPQKRDEDVLVMGSEILFVTPTGVDRCPPLRYFADALAEQLLDNRALGGVWTLALAEYEGATDPQQGFERFQDFLKKQGALGLDEAYRRLLHPLSPEAEANLRRHLDEALARLGCRLRNSSASIMELRSLCPGDLVPPEGGWGNLEEADLQRCLANAGWSEEEKLFQPSFSCQDYNRRRWEGWLSEHNRKDRLLMLAASHMRPEEGAPSSPTDMSTDLDHYAETHLQKLNFDPEAIAWGWLAATVPDFETRLGSHRAEEIDALLPPLVRYQPVREVIQAAEAGWHPHSLSPHGPLSGERQPVTPEQTVAEIATKIQVGAEAEQALLTWVEQRTRDLLQKYGNAGWKVLSAALPPRGRVWQRLEEARQEQIRLGEALHVSRVWGSAGFDLLGLTEDQNGQPIAVRYEVKSVPAHGDVVSVFLSPNELAMYQQVHRNARQELDEPRYRGDWQLVAVDPNGRAVDVTKHLEPLLDDQARLLAPLRQKGFTPTGLKLTIERGQKTPK